METRVMDWRQNLLLYTTNVLTGASVGTMHFIYVGTRDYSVSEKLFGKVNYGDNGDGDDYFRSMWTYSENW